MRETVARRCLIFWCLFIGIGAVAGATGMFVAPDGSAMGMQELLPYFQVLPFADVLFQNYIFPGIALLIVNGLTNLTAAVLLLKKSRLGIYLGMLFGFTLMLWICIQFVIFPANIMSISYFIFGLIQFLTGYACLVFTKQRQYQRLESTMRYQNIGKVGRDAVVYFSRMGYTRKAALRLANDLGADVIELKTTELTEYTKGFWWCGRFGMHQWGMPLEPIKEDLKKYEKVYLCSPIWVFHISAPMRQFCKEYQGKLKQVGYLLVHYNKMSYEWIYDEMDRMLQTKHTSGLSICCHQGREIKRWGNV